MEAMLLALTLSCADGAWILAGLTNAETLDQSLKSEVRIEVIQAMPDNCSDDEYNPTGRK